MAAQQQQQQQHLPQAQQQPATVYPDPWQNYEYFHQYGKLGIHTEMIKDEHRTQSYLRAVEMHAADLKDKVVLDLGCGTGILSFFCARAGAKTVYAVEASDLANWTELVVASNGLSDRIKVLKGRIEELQLPEYVDVIISEWMGTFLIFESMLESVLYARDYMLKPEGVMLPSHANIYLAPVCMDDMYRDRIEFWRSVYGVDMSVLIPFAKKCAFEKPIIDKPIKPEQLISPAVPIKTMDLRNIPKDEPYQKTIVNFEFKAAKAGNLHGFVAWFDVLFKGSVSNDDAFNRLFPQMDETTERKADLEKECGVVTLSTSPGCKDTHWHQDLLLFDDPIFLEQGHTIKGTIRYQRNPDLLRHLIIDISFSVVEQPNRSAAKKFFLWGNE